jgi:hypothetical protein
MTLLLPGPSLSPSAGGGRDSLRGRRPWRAWLVAARAACAAALAPLPSTRPGSHPIHAADLPRRCGGTARIGGGRSRGAGGSGRPVKGEVAVRASPRGARRTPSSQHGRARDGGRGRGGGADADSGRPLSRYIWQTGAPPVR